MTTNGAADRPGAPRHEVEAPGITDELYEAFPNRPAVHGMNPKDGIPQPVPPHSITDALAPDLDPAKFVCMADLSMFVVRDPEWGDIIERFEPSVVERAPDGGFRVKVHRRRLFGSVAEWQEVEPIRPQCEHYARQLVPFPDDADWTLIVRLCTVRRTDEGEFLSLGNQLVLGCELRSPVYGNESQKIDVRDDEIIAAARKKKAQAAADDFDVTAALAAERQ